jgi:hypothetical protein
MIARYLSARALPALAFVCGLAHFSSAQAATTITSLPARLDASGTTYVLGSDLTYSGSGPAITIGASNVTLDGGGRTVRYCDSSSTCSGITLGSGVSGVTVKNVTLQQGSGSGNATAIGGWSNSNVIIDGVRFNLRAKASATYGVNVNTSSAGSELRNSTMTITGNDFIEAIQNDQSAAWNVHHNTINVNGVGYSSTYPRVINTGSGSQYHNNTINVDGNSRYVNMFVSWQQSNVKIYANKISYASHHGRPIHLDDSSSGFEIYDNDIKITSQNTGEEVVYVFRLRSDAGHRGSSNHRIHHNTVDASGATSTLGVSIGADTYANANNEFSYNIFRSRSSPIDFYGDYASNTSFFCNKIEHTSSSGYPITVYGTLHTGISFENNLITTQRSDGAKIRFGQAPSSSGTWKFANTGITLSNITGSLLSSAFSLLSSTTKGSSGCYEQAGARLTSAPRPLAPSGVTVQ